MATEFLPILGYKYNIHSGQRNAEENPNELKVEMCLFGPERNPTQQENLIGLCVFWIQRVEPLGPPFVTSDGIVWMNLSFKLDYWEGVKEIQALFSLFSIGVCVF